MAGFLIVDGYNLARSGALPLTNDPSGPEGREELCALVSGYARAKGFRLDVVFDARGRGSRDRGRSAFKGGTAVYASRGESADDVIRELCRKAPAGTIVVTSDRGLAGTLPSRAVTVLSSEEFADRLFSLRLETMKGTADDREQERRKEKRGEGRKAKKRDRERERRLRKL